MSVNLTFGSACSPKHVVTPGEPDMAPWARNMVPGLSPRGRGNLVRGGCG